MNMLETQIQGAIVHQVSQVSKEEGLRIIDKVKNDPKSPASFIAKLEEINNSK